MSDHLCAALAPWPSDQAEPCNMPAEAQLTVKSTMEFVNLCGWHRRAYEQGHEIAYAPRSPLVGATFRIRVKR